MSGIPQTIPFASAEQQELAWWPTAAMTRQQAKVYNFGSPAGMKPYRVLR